MKAIILLVLLCLGAMVKVYGRKRLCHCDPPPSPRCAVCPRLGDVVNISARLSVRYYGNCFQYDDDRITTGSMVFVGQDCGREGDWGVGVALGGSAGISNSQVDLHWTVPGNPVFHYETNTCIPWTITDCQTITQVLPGVPDGFCTQVVTVCDVSLW